MSKDPLRTYAMMAKPVSSACNLRCGYCYYADKEKALNVGRSHMSDAVLEAFIVQNLAMHGSSATVEFAWHGGEPALAGVGFYEKVVELQQKHGEGRQILNSIQTNATLLTDDFCSFFKDNDFVVGVSVDGPDDLHDAYRKGLLGEGSFADTLRGMKLLKKHGIPFNTLTTVNRINQDRPGEVYSFLRKWTDWMQFLPVVERDPGGSKLLSFSVTPSGYGSFLCSVYNEWKRRDKGRKHVQIIDVTMGNLLGEPSSLCVHNPLCGHSGCVEANGDVYSCDRFAFPEYLLGNIRDRDLGDLMESNRAFGMHKTYGMSAECMDCQYVRLCFGGCPKDRLQDGRNYLCEGYKAFFSLVAKEKPRYLQG